METPQFSVVVPTLNRQEMLIEAVESVLAQSFTDFEVIVVNDGGLSPRLPDDARIRLIDQDNNGMSAARNAGINAAKGDFIVFLDDDDTLSSERLAMVLPELQRKSAVICSKSLGTPASSEVVWFLRRTGLGAVQFAIRRDKCPYFDESLRQSEDLDWALRVLQMNDWAVMDQIGYYVREHSGVRVTSQTYIMAESRQQLFDKHVEYFSARPDVVAYQWKVVGALAMARREYDLAQTMFLKALKVSPSISAAVRLAGALGGRLVLKQALRSRLGERGHVA